MQCVDGAVGRSTRRGFDVNAANRDICRWLIEAERPQLLQHRSQGDFDLPPREPYAYVSRSKRSHAFS